VSVHQLIRDRRSVGAFTNQPVDLVEIEQMLESAVYAPNHRLTQPWRFIFITGQGVERYARLRADMVGAGNNYQPTYEKFANIPLYIIVAIKRSTNPEIAEEDALAAAALVQNFLLLAAEAGLGTAWKTFKPDPRLRDFARLADDENVIAILHVGYSAEAAREGQRKSIHDRITVIDSPD